MPRRKRAYRQGDLDGLCGIYSVVNALRYLLRLKEEDCRALFATLVEALHHGCRRPHDHLLWGIPFPKLKRLVDAAQLCEFLDWGQTFRARRLRLRRNQRTLPEVWSALAQELRPTCVAVIGITGATDHWCVVYRITPKTLWVLDSSGRARIRRSRCTVRPSRTRYCLEVGEILLIER